MINFKFDDRTDIEGKISNSYVNQENPEETIRDLARYNYHVLGMKKEDNYDTILSYMTKNFFSQISCSTLYYSCFKLKNLFVNMEEGLMMPITILGIVF